MKEMKLLVIVGFVIIALSACQSKNKGAQVANEKFVLTDTVTFSFSEAKGLGKDSLFNRRDNSDIIKVGNKYYVWYTKMHSPEIRGYWGTIWYATSEDEGHTWTEQGMALGLGDEGAFDSHAVFTPNILVYKGKYYLYYTAVKPTAGMPNNAFENNWTTDVTAIGVAVADSPDGPFVRIKSKPLLVNSEVAEDFDSYRVDDAALLVKDGKIHLYYKGRSIVYGKKGHRYTQMGVAIADQPEGPFVKHPEPLIDKSHEVLVWQQEDKVLALACFSKSIYISDDGINFSLIQKDLKELPYAPGLYRPHLEDGNAAKSIPGWGLSLRTQKGLAYFVRFEME